MTARLTNRITPDLLCSVLCSALEELNEADDREATFANSDALVENTRVALDFLISHT